MEDAIPDSGPINAPVHPSLGLTDLGALLRDAGFDAEPYEDDGRVGYRMLTEPRFTVLLQTPFDKRPGEYCALFLHGSVRLTPDTSAAVIHALRLKTMFAHLATNLSGRLFATHTIIIAGGVTAFYLRNQLWHWQKDLRMLQDEVRKQTRRVLGQTVH